MTDIIANLHSSAFVLAVPDLTKSAAYFRDVLGFHLTWPEGLGWQQASRGSVRIMMGHSPNALSPADTGDHNYFAYLYVDDADALYEEFLRNGAIVLAAPENKSHGMREFTVATPDGHRMMIGQDLT